MPRLTITITDDQSDYLDEVAGDAGDYESKSAAIREFIEAAGTRDELHTEIERLRDRLDDREDRIEDLESQLRKRSNIEDKIEDLPDKIRDAETYTERRQRKLDQATLPKRVVWKFTGVPVDDED